MRVGTSDADGTADGGVALGLDPGACGAVPTDALADAVGAGATEGVGVGEGDAGTPGSGTTGVAGALDGDGTTPGDGDALAEAPTAPTVPTGQTASACPAAAVTT